jgi:hypothetical protein
MVQTDTANAPSTTRGGAGVLAWIFRDLVVACAAFMLYTWLQPWWSANVAVIPGDSDIVMHPWGVDVAGQVRANIDESAFEMPFPGLFAGFMWVYLGVCMLALAVSLFWTGRLRLGPINVSWAMVFILLVGLSYMTAVGLAFGIGTLKAGASGAHFIGKSNVVEPQTGAKLKMTSDLLIGYWLALGAGGVLTFLGLIRFLLVRKPKV